MTEELTPWLETQFHDIDFTFVIGYNTANADLFAEYGIPLPTDYAEFAESKRRFTATAPCPRDWTAKWRPRKKHLHVVPVCA